MLTRNFAYCIYIYINRVKYIFTTKVIFSPFLSKTTKAKPPD